MSRKRVHEVSSPISLFPFIGILLCTMGALLVVLVAVSRSARNTAQREVQARHKAAAQPADVDVHKKLAKVTQYMGSLNTVRSEAEHKLRDEQLRLSHLEDHIRRLQEKMRSLQSAAVELDKMEEEHHDDRQQAEREVKRLYQLIGDAQKTVASLKEAGNQAPRSYAVVPYEGPNGTYRRPIYIECVNDELILQPEDVHITLDDLSPPIGPGNALAAALRASRDHLVRMNPQIGQSHDLEPYPLLLVRPSGLEAYDRARQAIDAGDFDLGFELVESDWKVKYPQADPQLAGVQQQALEQARARRVFLAAAAPRAFRSAAVAAAGELDFDDGAAGGAGGGTAGNGGTGVGGVGSGRGTGGSRTYLVRSGRHGSGDGNGGGEGDGDGGFAAGQASGEGNSGAAGNSAGSSFEHPNGAHDASSGVAENAGSPGAGGGNASAGQSGPSEAGGSPGGSSPPGEKPADKNLVPDGYQSQESASVTVGSHGPGEYTPPDPRPDPRTAKDRMNPAAARGKDWALGKKPERSVPIRRTIRVAVRNDQLAFVSESASSTASRAGKVIPLRGDTVESLDDFVKEVHEQIDGWGMAGNGLYWRPVIVLSVAPDGQRRANDLARLLKNSGLEIAPTQLHKKCRKEHRMKRVEMEADQMPGQDSFLDVITNIVGILILLVLVVGLRTSRSVRDAPAEQAANEKSAQDQLKQAYNSAMSTELGVRDLIHRVGNAYDEANFREEERVWINTNVAKGEQEIAERRAKLSADKQLDFDVRQKLNEAQSQLDELTRQQLVLMSQEPATEQIECQPTALAKAVTGKEVHLLLSDDHLAIVPFDELIEQMKEDVNSNAWRLRGQDDMERTIGPINGFRLRYCFVKDDVMRASEAGTFMTGQVSRFSHCYFLPVTTPIGEPAAESLRPNSELFQHLQRLRPEGTTITIWTYAGNYERLRQLKRAIREVGFQIAVRPLPKGMPLGASRHGSESLSE